MIATRRGREQADVGQNPLTFADVISTTAETGESAWYLAPASSRMLVGRVLDQLSRLSHMTGWDIRDLPAKLGCRGTKLSVSDLQLDELERSSSFLDVLLNLISTAMVPADDLRFVREHARYVALLVVRTQAASRAHVRTVASDESRPDQNDMTLGLTITAVTSVRNANGKLVSLVELRQMRDRTNELRSGHEPDIDPFSAFGLLRSVQSSVEIDDAAAYAPVDAWFGKADDS